MSAFYLWLPSQLAPKSNQYELVVTNGDGTAGIPDCKDFYNYLLELANITPAQYKIRVKPARSRYHSEYLENDNWEDQWPLVWKVAYIFSQELSFKWPYPEQNVSIDKLFSCRVKLNKSLNLDCILTAYFLTPPQQQKAIKYLGSLKRESDMLVVYEPTLVKRRKIYRTELRFPRCKPSDFKLKAPLWQDILLTLKAYGGYCHFEDLSLYS
jgi:hypothetical protein